MAVFRFLAGLFLLAAVIALAADVTPALHGGGSMHATSFATHWEQIAPATLEVARNYVSASSASALWIYLIEPLISLPSFVLFGGLAALFGYWGRRRHRVQIFVN